MKSFVGGLVSRGVRDHGVLGIGFFGAVAAGAASSSALAVTLGRAATEWMGVSSPVPGAAYVGAALVVLVVRALSQWSSSLLSEKIVHDLTLDAHDRLMSHALMHHPGDGSRARPEILGEIQTVTQRLRWNVLAGGLRTLGSGAVATALATIAMVMATRVATIAIAFSVVLAIVVAVFASRNQNSLRRMGETHVEALLGLRERLEFAREARALGAIEPVKEASRALNVRAADAHTAHARLVLRHGAWLELLGAGALAAFAVTLDVDAPHDVATALAALVLLVRPAQASASGLQQMVVARREVDRLAATLLDAPPPEAPFEGPVPADGLVLVGVGARYAERHVLEGASLDVRPGEIVAVLGPSGEGKTTLLEIAVGARRCGVGAVFVEGVRVVARADARALGLGFAPQRPAFVSGTLRENVDPRGDARDEDVRAALADAALDDLLARSGLDGTLARAGAELSTGERARLALARALLLRPRYLVLDEPTASLDDALEARVMATLVGRAQAGVGVLVATHRASTAAHAHRRVRLRDGKLEDID